MTWNIDVNASRRRRLSVLSIIAAAAVFLSLTLVQQWYYLRQDMAEDFNSLAAIMATNANAALVFNDNLAGAELLASLSHSSEVLEAALYRADGGLFAYYGQRIAEASPGASKSVLAAAILPPQDFGTHFSAGEMLIGLPLYIDARPVGSFLLRVSLREIYYTLARTLAGLLAISGCALAIAHLVTRRLRRRVGESERLFDSFFNSSPAGMVILDPALRIVRVNRTLAEVNGASIEDHIGRPVDAVVPNLSQTISRYHRAAIETGRVQDVEISGHPPGRPSETRYWLNTFFPLRDAAGNIVASGCVVIDITERRQAEQAQRETDARLRSVTDHLPVVLFQLELGDDLRFKYIGDGASMLLGDAPDRYIAEPGQFSDALRAEDAARFVQVLGDARAAAPGTVIAWSGCFERGPKRGTWIEMRASVTPPSGDGRSSLNGLLLDVTELRKVQEQNEQSRLLLQRLSTHRENLIDEEHKRISLEIHDQIGQLLTTALLRVRVLQRILPPERSNALQTIADIDALLNEAYRSIKDIAASLRPAVLNFSFQVAAEWAAERALKNTPIACRIEVQDGVSPLLSERQSTAFFRIIQEALSNCVRHADARNVTISLASQAGSLILTVADDGRGLGGDLPLPHLCLGLFGIQERALALGGTASISGPRGKGVTVKVVVPLVSLESPVIGRH